eukprot:TRINITY_DN2771_c0_g2_i4.p1 TRINITY_DN2771_c0_g2~~TRINITY_DN2771_c0_g2_i4.p1  ORF type:complete len:220 (-),score=55.40 TRINITY_DN2771_c0_g2_i4:15-674(-)
MSKRLKLNISISMKQFKQFIGRSENVSKGRQHDSLALPAIHNPARASHLRAHSLLHYGRQHSTKALQGPVAVQRRAKAVQRTLPELELGEVLAGRKSGDSGGESGKTQEGSARSELKEVQRAWLKAESAKARAKEIITETRICVDKRKHLLVNECFKLMGHLLELSFSKEILQLKALELLGDIMVEFRDYNNALLYLSLIHICRCRRYAVCRSRWSPYH